MTRREIREEIFKILFSLDFYEKDSQEEQIRLALAELQSGEVSIRRLTNLQTSGRLHVSEKRS